MNNKFPKDFLWGASASAYQVEGGNVNNWSEWEKKNSSRLAKEAENKWLDWQKEKFPEMFKEKNYLSGRACDHYNRFEEDFDLAKEGKHNAHRFSIEWSRIEPKEGEFDKKEIEHYRQVVKAIKDRGMEPFICLWHWTNPLWLGEAAESKKNFSFYFSRYARRMVEELGGEVKFWLTLNEPTSVIASGYISGAWPPGRKNIFQALRIYKNLAQAHKEAYWEMKKINSDFQIGFANILHSFRPYRENNWLDKLAVRVGKYLVNEKFLNLTGDMNDFLTVQYYFHNRFKFPRKIRLGDKDVSDLNWEIYPKGLYDILVDLREKKLPIYITENGLADSDDLRRSEFIREHLFWIKKAIDEGVDIQGYFYWSLTDNFEWDKGFWPRFGLVEIDYKTLKRKPRRSFYEYKKIIENNGLE